MDQRSAVLLALVCIALLLLVASYKKVQEGYQDAIEFTYQGSSLVRKLVSNACEYKGVQDTTGVLTSTNVFDSSYQSEGLFAGGADDEVRCYISHHDYIPGPTSCSTANPKIYTPDVASLVKDVRETDLGPEWGKRCTVIFNKDQDAQAFRSYLDLLDRGDKVKADERQKQEAYTRDAATEAGLAAAARENAKKDRTQLADLVSEGISLDAKIASLSTGTSEYDSKISLFDDKRFYVQHPDGRVWKKCADSDKICLNSGTETVYLARHEGDNLFTQFGERIGLSTSADSLSDVPALMQTYASDPLDFDIHIRPFQGSTLGYSWRLYENRDGTVRFVNDHDSGVYIGYDSARDAVTLVQPSDTDRMVDWKICYGDGVCRG